MAAKRLVIAISLIVLSGAAISKWLAYRQAQDIGIINDMLAAADVKKGQEIAHECEVCHSFEAGGPNRIGPNLFGIVGARIARRNDFEYSHALRQKQDLTWTIDHLDEWLKDPAAFVPENKMIFSGLLDPQDRMDLIAYLMTLK
jgi:cytochrome c